MIQISNPQNHLKRAELIAHGHVQGVYFREFINQFLTNWNKFANQDDLVTGLISNLEDSTVGITIEGQEDTLERIMAIFYIGSPQSQVERVEENQWESIEKREFSNFSRTN